MRDFDQFDFDDVPVLEAVRSWAHSCLPSAIAAVQLIFQQGSVYISVEDEFDTLLCSRTAPDLPEDQYADFFTHFWDHLLDHALTNAWRMTNDRGYPDAFQLRFRSHPSGGPYSIVQLYGEGSQITVTEYAEIHRVALARVSDST